MAGYKNFSMSNRAVKAYEQGEKPFSKWTKKGLLEEIEKLIKNKEIEINFDFNNLKKIKAPILKKEMLLKSSWHHTSSYYNQTDFYSINIEKLERITNDDLINLSEKTLTKAETKKELWKCRFLEWTGTRKHPKAKEIIEIGEIKGNYFFRSDGTKKLITAKGFCKIKKV